MKITQIHFVEIKGDAISNLMRGLKYIFEYYGYQNQNITELFSDYSDTIPMVGSEFNSSNILLNFKKFVTLEKKYYYLIKYLKNQKLKKKNLTKNLIEDSDIRIWHFGMWYPLMKNFHQNDIIFFQNITFPYLTLGTNQDYVIESRQKLLTLKDLEPRFLTPSKFNKKTLELMGFNPSSIEIIPLWHTYKLKYQKKHFTKPNLIAWGRYSFNKSIPELVSMAKINNLNLTVFGDNKTLKEFYLQYKEALNISKFQDNIKLYGKIDSFESILSKSNIYICNSRHEGFNMPAIEAMANSLPVILRSGTAMDELITNGKEGYLYKHISEVPNLINKIMKNYSYHSKMAWERSKVYYIDNIKYKMIKYIMKL